MLVANAIAEVLKREGVKFIIGYPVNPIIEAAAEADIRTIIVRQERVGLHMADALSRPSPLSSKTRSPLARQSTWTTIGCGVLRLSLLRPLSKWGWPRPKKYLAKGIMGWKTSRFKRPCSFRKLSAMSKSSCRPTRAGVAVLRFIAARQPLQRTNPGI